MGDELKPKQRDAGRTRARILAAAQAAFAQVGYSRATIRDIAAAAGVNSALVARYYGAKAELFRAALADTIQLNRLEGVTHAEFAKAVVGNFSGSDTNIFLPTMALVSITEEEPKRIVDEVHEEYVIPALAKWLGPPRARARAVRILILTAGFVVYARQLRAGSREHDHETVDWFSRALQDVVDDVSGALS